ncbi:MAG: ABC transporter ATP-binding protein [Thermoplasmatota archaeon]
MPAVETKGLTKMFGGLAAVDSLDLSIEEGETYGLIGPNGSGKTTLIKILCGLLSRTSGTARVLGEAVPPRRMREMMGYMPQDVAVYMDNTVHENLALFGRLYGMSEERIRVRERELLEFVNLRDWRDALASTLSGGMRHRLSLACALIHEPRLLFLDEPTVGVDPELRATFWEYFEAMAERGVTVVITTHYMDEASHCTRVGLLRQGRLIAEGRPQELMDAQGRRSLEDVFLSLARRGAE